MMEGNNINRLIELWGISGELIEIQHSVWRVGQYILKSGSKSALERNAHLLTLLKAEGIPVAEIVPAPSGELVLEQDNKYYLMTKCLPGGHIESIYDADYKTIGYKTGETVALLHRAFRNIENDVSFSRNSFDQELRGWIYQTLEKDGWQIISKAEFDNSSSTLLEHYDKLPSQIIHRDMHYGNMLFDGDTFSGYIDFDLSKYDVRLFDLCYFLIGLLVGHENQPHDVAIWRGFKDAFLAGYENTEELSAIEKECIPYMMVCIEILFVAFFIREKKPEFADSAVKLYRFISRCR